MKARLPLITLLAVLVVNALPLVTQAAKLDLYNPRKRYGDEKKIIADAASRCTGAAFKKLHTDAEVQAKKDLVKLVDADGNVTQSIADAFKLYAQDIALGWGAMQEPYCGFGAFGATAAKKSFTKTIVRGRADFMAKIAKKKASDPKVSATTLSLLPSATSEVTPASAVITPVVAAPIRVVAPEPPPTAAPTITRTLKRGDTFAEVKLLQQFLVEKGYLNADSATGYFGPQTEKAVIAFQKAKKVITSHKSAGAGLVGPKTRRLLSL